MTLSRRSLLLSSALASTGLLSACAPTQRAPESTFVLLDGSTLHSSALQGKVYLVNFWATTCIACVREMPYLVETYQKYRERGFDTIAVAMSYDPPAWVLNFAQTRQIPFRVALDNTGELARNWGDVKLTPTTFVVDRQGRIVKHYVGEPDFTDLHRSVERLLAQA